MEQPRILPYTNQMFNSITYEVSRTRILIVRHDFGLFEWFEDMGGFFGLFFEFVGPAIISILLVDGATI